MKVYEGKRKDEKCLVTVNDKSLDPCNDIRNHSPDGFQWGYSGSGPSQLALAILANYFCIRETSCSCGTIKKKDVFKDYHHDARCPLGEVLGRLHRLHHRFKELYIANFSGNEWKLTEEDVRLAVLELEQEEKARQKLSKP